MGFFFINLDLETPTRFDFAKFIDFDIDNFDPITSNLLHDIQEIKVGGKFIIKGQDGRPDQISYAIYQDYQFWWLIMLYNGIFDINELINGKVLNYVYYGHDFRKWYHINQTVIEREEKINSIIK